MKKSLLFSAISGLVALGFIFMAGCNKPAPQGETNKTPVSAEKNSFQEVTSRLDAGGNFYLYLGTEQWLDGLSAKVSGWQQLITSFPDLKADDRDNVNKAFDIVTRVIKSSGAEDVSGVGMSSIAIEKGIYRNKLFVHHYPGKGSGFLWTMFGQKPHVLDGLDLLPPNTALAAFSDFDLPQLWSVIRDETAQSGFPQAQAALHGLPDQFEKSTGLKWDQVLASLGGEFGVVLTLNESNMIAVPLPGNQLQIPEPGLMIVAKVKDDTVFNRMDAAMEKAGGQQVIRVDKPDLKMRTMPVPLPLPIQLRPTVATSGGYLFIASSDSLITEALAVKSGQKAGLKSTEEFKHLARDIPQEGNGFTYVSRRLGQTIMQVERQALQGSGRNPDAANAWLQSIMQSQNAGFGYCVSANTDAGRLSVGNGNQSQATVVLMSAVAVPATLAAMILPALAKAKARAQQIACVNNMKQLGLAAKMWATDNKDMYPQNFLTMSNELNNPRVLICPADAAHPAAATWSSFTSANCSYEFLAAGATDTEPNRVVFRCPIHGSVTLGDGSVQVGIAKTHPDWLVERDGKFYYQPPNSP
jgi:hypothetical protein